MATILRAQLSGSTYDLDVFDDVEFRLDISAIEAGEIGEVFGVSSQNLELPPTKNNNDFFENLYDLGSTPAVTFIKTTPCQVLQDGQEVFSGVLYLDSVVTDNDNDIVYNVVVANETIDFKYTIQDLTFDQVDFSHLNHNYNMANVTSSWDENLFGGDIVYPLAEYGLSDNDIVSGSLLKSGGEINTFTNQDYPLDVTGFKPAVRVRAIVDAIFDSIEYSYTSSLLESDYFDSVYVLMTKDENQGVTIESPVSQSFRAYNTANQEFTASVFTPLEFPTETYDNGDNWNSLDTYRAKANGQYGFSVSLAVSMSSQPVFLQGPRSVELDLFVNGASANIPTAYFNLSGKTSDTLQANWSSINLNANDLVTLRFTYIPESGDPSIVVKGGVANNFFQCYQSPTSVENGIVNIGNLFKTGDKVQDFISGLIQKFNLVIEPIPGERNTLSIETFNDWVDAGQQIDWSNKVDYNQKWEIRHPLQDQPRLLTFNDEEDIDSINQFKINTTGIRYGQYNYESESDLALGEKEIGKYFAPTPMKFIPGTTDFIVPQIHGLEEGNKTRVAFKPRLLHYLGKYDATQLRGKRSAGDASGGEYYVYDGSTTVTLTEYPVFHHNNALPSVKADTKDLHFGNTMFPGHWSYHQSYVNAQAKKSAVYEYWSFYLNELYDIDARKVTLNVLLAPHEIADIRLNDKIFINGHYYRIDKISGANITREDSVKVTLLKTLPRKLRFPKRRITIDDTISDITIDDASIDATGMIGYVDVADGGAVTDPALVQTAAGRDGLSYFGGTTATDNIPSQAPPRNVINYGQNFISDRVEDSIIIGNGNQLNNGNRNAVIVGSNNQIKNQERDTFIIGNNVTVSGSIEECFIVSQGDNPITAATGSSVVALNPVEDIRPEDSGRVLIGNVVLQGQQYERYDLIEATPGGEIYLTGSANSHFHHHFTWTGANGTFTAYLPDATAIENDGLQLRNTFNGDFGADKRVTFIPTTGSIDGGAEFEVNKAYKGFTAAILDGEWVVIQEKA